ncbi:MAG: NADH-quinone oxidoreductase subunit A [Planctomycetales bacterium]
MCGSKALPERFLYGFSMATPTAIAGYLLLFVAIGAVFLFANLLVGRFVRPDEPHAEKKEINECGEPAIGSSFVQFDLRYYVVALVFIVFDAEVAFLFPAATVFGKQTHLQQLPIDRLVVQQSGEPAQLGPAAGELFKEMGVESPQLSGTSAATTLQKDIREFTYYVYYATLVFFFVLFVGFAYEWKTGAFDWVRAVTRTRGSPAAATEDKASPVLSN